VCYSAGEVIVKQGTLMDYVFFLNEGYIKKVIETEVNRNILLEVMCPDQFIGLNCINVSDACPASFIALTDCRVCQIRKQHFLKVLLSNEEFNSDVLRISGRESMKLYNKLALFGSRNNHGRLANALLYLDSDQFSQIDIYSQISRKELAELAAISTESMNKILKEFREDLIIEINGKAIRILRPDLLERISRIG
jgi:CRP/FNR family transcriptional regulator